MATDEQGWKALTVDVSRWANRNLWPLSSGEIAVRPGLNSLLAAGSGFFVGGGSIQNQRTDEAFHYLVTTDFNYATPTLSVYDENFTLLQSIALATSRRPRAVCVNQVVDQVIVSSPDFPTYWGVVGGGLVRMTQGTSEIDGRSLINPPRGLSVSWGDRCVIASDNLVYFSDPTLPRVFDPANAVDPPGGAVYGMHVSEAGSLILCTTSGVYSLSIDAAASGYIVLGVWQKVTDFACHNYQTTCHVRGELFGLSQRGYRRIDSEGSKEVLLDDPRLGFLSTEGSSTPAIFPDYRRGVMVQTDQGPAVTIDRLFHRTDLESGLQTWWENTQGFELRLVCTLRESDGTELFVLETDICRVQGTAELASDGSTTVVGGYFGTVSFPPDLNPVIRWVDWSTDAPTASVSLDTAQGDDITLSQVSPVIGTDAWGAFPWAEAKYRSHRFDFAARESDVTLKMVATGACRRVDQQLNVWYKGPGLKRRQ